MKSLPSESPAAFCEAFTRQELTDLKEKEIWNSWHPIMERILNRSSEMKPVYIEMCECLYYSPYEPSIGLRLALEAIWASGKLFNQDTLARKRHAQKELAKLHDDIPALAFRLSEMLRRQKELFETEDFSPGEYLDCVGMISRAGNNNGHFTGWLQEELEALDHKYDGKYWPSLRKMVGAIGEFEESLSLPSQGSLPDEVLAGRSSHIKDFVLGFDADVKRARQIPRSFSFSNSAVATIINVVMDLPVDSLATSDAVRVVRNRYRTGQYSS